MFVPVDLEGNTFRTCQPRTNWCSNASTSKTKLVSNRSPSEKNECSIIGGPRAPWTLRALGTQGPLDPKGPRTQRALGPRAHGPTGPWSQGTLDPRARGGEEKSKKYVRILPSLYCFIASSSRNTLICSGSLCCGRRCLGGDAKRKYL